MEKIRVFTAFSGYDSQCLGLDRLKKKYPEFDYELVGWSEIDKYAIQAHNAIYPQWADRNYGDISKINWDEVPDFDLFTYSSPCQDFSNAGLQKGGEEGSGTRSSLLWECRRAIVAKKPKFLLMENVAALVSQKFIKTFNKWQEELARYGYTNFAQVLNAKDYGIPQNRERIFLVSVLGDAWYNFPQPFKLEKRLKDVLETNVDEKYYLSEKTIAMFDAHRDKQQALGRGFGFEAEPRMYNDVAPTLRSERSGLKVLEPSVMTPKRTEFGKSVRKEYEKGELDISRHAMTVLTPREDGISNTLTSVQKDNLVCEPLFIPEATARGYAEAAEGDSVNLEQPSSKTRRGRVGNQMANTLTTSCNQGVVVSEPKIQSHYRIRKLTPRECFRLMNVDEDVIDQIQAAGISNSQQYKLAGNSIVVACLEKIFEQMFFPQYTNSRTLFG